MSTSPVLRNALPAPDTAPRVVLRGQPPAAQVEASPASPGVWVTEQQLDALKREWSDQAHDAGYAEGLRVAREAARQQAEADATAQLERELKSRDEKHAKAQADKWRSLATALAGQMQSLRDELQDQVSEWTFAATARLLGLRARADVGAAVRHVLDEAELDGPVTVLLHAQDLATVQHAHATDPAGWPAGVSFAASERVTLGGCQLQASAQTLDARLEVQLALLREALDRARHEQARQQVPATDA